MNDYHTFVVRVWTGDPEHLRFQVQHLQSGEEWQCAGPAALGRVIAERVHARAHGENPHQTANSEKLS